MEINKAYLLFEQSGTFKNALKARGIEAEDFDILDDFGETDHVVDLFAEINKAYEGKESIFDQIKPEDIIFAFFPCICTIIQMKLKSLKKRWKNGQSKKQKVR